MNPFRYAMELRWSKEDECYIGIVPELPGCISHGATPEEVAKNLTEAALLWVETAHAAKRKVPAPVSAEDMVRGFEKANEHLRKMIQAAVKQALGQFKQEEMINPLLGQTGRGILQIGVGGTRRTQFSMENA